MRARYRLEWAEVRIIELSRLLEASQRVFKSNPRVLIPKMPAAPKKFFGTRNLQTVAKLRPARNPTSVFSKNALDFSDSDRNGVMGHLNTVPSLPDHPVVVDQPALVLN